MEATVLVEAAIVHNVNRGSYLFLSYIRRLFLVNTLDEENVPSLGNLLLLLFSLL